MERYVLESFPKMKDKEVASAAIRKMWKSRAQSSNLSEKKLKAQAVVDEHKIAIEIMGRRTTSKNSLKKPVDTKADEFKVTDDADVLDGNDAAKDTADILDMVPAESPDDAENADADDAGNADGAENADDADDGRYTNKSKKPQYNSKQTKKKRRRK